MKIQTTLEDFNPQHFYEYIIPLNNSIEIFKEKVRKFYYLLVLSDYRCPRCTGKLKMLDDSKCLCISCKYEFDPTLEFQKCPECSGDLIKKTYHYFCKHCNNQVYSRFCFEETAFNNEYFTEMMRKSREIKYIQRQAFHKQIISSRSDVYYPEEAVKLDEIEGLTETLNSFIESPIPESLIRFYLKSEEFDMEKYKSHILSSFEGNEMFFDEIPVLTENLRKDKIFRFITLIFMAHNKEVILNQYNNRILVEKVETV